MRAVGLIALVLVIVGALNWGLVGAFEYNLVDSLLGEGSGLSRAVYILVGLAGLYKLASLIKKETASAK